MPIAPMPPSAACSVANAPAAVVRAAAPDTPSALLARDATVRVYVELDDASHLTNAAVASSPDASLTTLALRAARRSAFRTATRNCHPVASRYVMTFSFPGRAAPVSSDAPVVTVDADGTASAPPDVAVAHVEFATHAATPAAAIAQNDALATRYVTALRALDIGSDSIVTGYYDVLPDTAYTGAAGDGFFAVHEIQLTTTIASLQPVFDAASQSGATAGSVAYDVLDRTSLYEAAVLAATRDAVLRTDHVAVERHVLRGPMLRSQTMYASTVPLEAVTFRAKPDRPVIPASHPVEVRVRLAVTYTLHAE